ncbi:MAG: hypothetical protein QM674_16590 [Burkholderiaceae bacterium]
MSEPQYLGDHARLTPAEARYIVRDSGSRALIGSGDAADER